MGESETGPLLPFVGQQNPSINEGTDYLDPNIASGEMSHPTQWPGPKESGESITDVPRQNIAFGSTEHSSSWLYCVLNTICPKIKFIFDSQWPLTCFLAIAFLGFWLPVKRKSIWPLTFVPVFLLLFGVGAHFYFMLTQDHRNYHIGSKMLLSSLWISGFVSYVLSLYYFRHQSQEWIRNLRGRQNRAINVALFTGLFLVSWVLFGDAYYQVIFDLVNIKATMLEDCRHPLACNAVFYTLASSIYWSMYSSVAVCCVFFSLCLVMANDIDKGYKRISTCTGTITDTLVIHQELRQQIAERVNTIRIWFLIHMLFYVLVLLANIFEWLEAARQLHFVYEYMAQICGTLVVLYKFFFPFLSASYVTWHESTLVQDLNDKLDFLPGETFHSRLNLELFLQQSRRRGYGFRLFKIQITLTIAIFSLLGSVFGLIHNFRS